MVVEIPCGNGAWLLPCSAAAERVHSTQALLAAAFKTKATRHSRRESKLAQSHDSKNQRIQPQGGEKHQQFSRGVEMGYFSCGEMM